MTPTKKKIRTPQPNQIHRFRLRNNLRLVNVASLAGLKSPSHISDWEKGYKLPSLKNALKLSAIIKCPVEVLFFELFDAIRRAVRERSKLSANKKPYDKTRH